MSEYQFVHFLAVDRPVEEKELGFMRRQSSRAEISPWEFTNEYHFGDFHGDARAMLRHGYDVHLHYASFGIRRLMFRLPGGLPCERRVFEAFRVPDAIGWYPDPKPPGGILEITPEGDADAYDEELWDIAKLLPKLAPVRERLIAGDLRPLYVAWLACCHDESATEPPIPAGLGKLDAGLRTMAEFYEVGQDLVAAAAAQAPAEPRRSGPVSRSRTGSPGKRRRTCLIAGAAPGGRRGRGRVETINRIRRECAGPAGRRSRRHGRWPNCARPPKRARANAHCASNASKTRREPGDSSRSPPIRARRSPMSNGSSHSARGTVTTRRRGSWSTSRGARSQTGSGTPRRSPKRSAAKTRDATY